MSSLNTVEGHIVEGVHGGVRNLVLSPSLTNLDCFPGEEHHGAEGGEDDESVARREDARDAARDDRHCFHWNDGRG